MQHPDEGTIHAWLDGELGADEVLALESHIATCPECSAKVAEARGLVAASSRIVSALDVIPGDVIPASTKTINRRPWYSTVQFRAAAGFLVVAGASLLLLNRGQEEAARSRMAEAPKESPVVASAPAAADAATELPAPPAKAVSEPKKPQSKNAVSGGRIAAKALALPAETMQSQSRAPEKVIDAPANVTVVGGVSRAPERAMLDEASADLKLLSSDTSQVAVKNVYEVRKGVEVTLVVATLPQRNFSASSAQMRKEARPMAAAAPPPVAASEAATNSITCSKGDKVFTLTGTMSRIQLEAIRLKLPEDKR